MARRTGETNGAVRRLRGKKSVFGRVLAAVAVWRKEGRLVGSGLAGSFSSLCLAPLSLAACKKSKIVGASQSLPRSSGRDLKAWLRGFDSKLRGPKGDGDTLQLVSTTLGFAADWPAGSAGPLDLESSCRRLGIAPSLPISPAANGRPHKHACVLLATRSSAHAS